MKPPCQLIGKNGNVFNLLAITRNTLKQHNLLQELQRFDSDFDEIKKSGGTYDDVLAMIMRYVEVE